MRGPETGWLEGATHVLPVRVYYEDTDTAGIVYYASWLRFMERGRTELVRAAGVDQNLLMAGDDWLAFVVRRLEIDYRAPARLDDALQVRTTVSACRRASMTMTQQVVRDGAVLVAAEVQIACVDAKDRPVRLPAAVTARLPVA